MKAHWYAKGNYGVMEVKVLSDLVSFKSTIPIDAQVWIPDDGSPFGPHAEWFRISARSRIVPVPREACNELRTALLLQGISCP